MRTFRVSARDESGAVAPIVAICLLMLFAFGALAVDLGSGYSTKRNLVTDGDAAAIAGARQLALMSPGAHSLDCVLAENPVTVDSSSVYSEVADVVNLNDGDSAVSDVAVECASGAGPGTVTVDVGKDATVTFAPAIGVDQLAVGSSSTAIYGPPRAVDGLRPFAVCQDDPHIQEWIDAIARGQANSPPTSPEADPLYLALKGTGNTYVDYPEPGEDHVDYPSGPGPDDTLATEPAGAYMSPGIATVHRIYFNNNQPNACGATSGNWGALCFVGGSACAGNAAIKQYLADGYPDAVDLGSPSPGDEDCAPPTGQGYCEPKTGNFPNNSVTTELDGLISSGEVFPILVYSGVTGPGANAEFIPSAFLGLRVRGYKATGPQADRYIDLEFKTYATSGHVGGSGSAYTGVRVWQLCSADGDPRPMSAACS